MLASLPIVRPVLDQYHYKRGTGGKAVEGHANCEAAAVLALGPPARIIDTHMQAIWRIQFAGENQPTIQLKFLKYWNGAIFWNVLVAINSQMSDKAELCVAW